MSKHYASVAQRAGYRCEYFYAPEAIFNLPFEVEHILPTARGGVDDPSNLALSCRSCNLYKSDRQFAPDELTASVVRLFNPRQDHWDEHFLAVPNDDMIQGLSQIGRATVICLRFNRESQREARRSWMRLGLFP